MTRPLACVRPLVVSGVLAQTLFWLCTLQEPRNEALPFDLVFLWLTAPAILLGYRDRSLPLAAGLAAASFAINAGLLLAALNAA
ncbi:hypothetical protein [Methylocystis echinoides]|uniref:hypothetical protein n=1 Tax=Methylocystis echinoides TaxID=29468 RepID=UPI00341E2262